MLWLIDDEILAVLDLCLLLSAECVCEEEAGGGASELSDGVPAIDDEPPLASEADDGDEVKLVDEFLRLNMAMTGRKKESVGVGSQAVGLDDRSS